MMAKRGAPPKRKAPKRKPHKIFLEELDGFAEYANSSPHNLTHKIRSEIDDGNSDLRDLVDAIHATDQYAVTNPRPDKKPLIKLLMSRGTTRAENELLADWIDRKVPPTRAGRPRRPVYAMSHDDHILSNARGDVEELRTGGLSVADAITQVAKEQGIPHKTLADAYHRRRRSMRKKK
jgi:hypothetical protein